MTSVPIFVPNTKFIVNHCRINKLQGMCKRGGGGGGNTYTYVPLSVSRYTLKGLELTPLFALGTEMGTLSEAASRKRNVKNGSTEKATTDHRSRF